MSTHNQFPSLPSLILQDTTTLYLAVSGQPSSGSVHIPASVFPVIPFIVTEHRRLPTFSGKERQTADIVCGSTCKIP
jgi:hypothetical protein